MPLFGRLTAPTFDLCWSKPKDGDDIILIPGGGGASKTGVKNLIHIANLSVKGFEFQESIKTDTDTKSNLCSSITSEIIFVCGYF